MSGPKKLLVTVALAGVIAGLWSFNRPPQAPSATALPATPRTKPAAHSPSPHATAVENELPPANRADLSPLLAYLRATQPEAEAALEPQQRADPDILLEALLQDYAQKHPDLATILLPSLEGNPHLQDLLYTSIARRWAATDLPAAFAWLKTLPAEARSRTLPAIADALAAHDPAHLATYLETLPPGDERELAYFKLAHRWAADDPVAAVAWLNQLPAALHSSQITGAVFYEIITQDSRLGADVYSQINDPLLKLELAETLGRSLAAKDSAWVRTWLNAQPADPAMQVVYDTFIKMTSVAALH